MAVPSFVPLIGSSFDALAGQQAGWAGFNRSVDEGNIQRANQAQEIQSRWLAQVSAAQAAAQQRDLELQLQAQSTARDAAAQARAEVESKRRFDIGTDLDKERIKAENARTKAQFDFPKIQEQKELDTIDRAATFLAPEVNSAGQKMESAKSDYIKSQQNFDTMRAQLEKNLPPGRFDAKLKEFKSSAGDKADVVKAVQTANEKLADATASMQASTLAYQTALDAFNVHSTNASRLGLQVGQHGDKWVVFSPRHNKTYGADETAPDNAPGKPSDDNVRVIDPNGTIGSISRSMLPKAVSLGFKTVGSPAPWPGLTPQTTTSTNVSLPVPAAQPIPSALARPVQPVPQPAAVTPSPQFGFQPQPSVLRYWGGRAADEALQETQDAARVATLPARAAMAVARPVGQAIVSEAQRIGGDIKQGVQYQADKAFAKYGVPATQWLKDNVMPPVPPGRVRVISPDGTSVGTIPVEQLEQAKSAGYKQVE